MRFSMFKINARRRRFRVRNRSLGILSTYTRSQYYDEVPEEHQWLCSVRYVYWRNRLWKKEIKPLVYIYSHEWINKMCHGTYLKSFADMLADKPDRDETFPPPELRVISSGFRLAVLSLAWILAWIMTGLFISGTFILILHLL